MCTKVPILLKNGVKDIHVLTLLNSIEGDENKKMDKNFFDKELTGGGADELEDFLYAFAKPGNMDDFIDDPNSSDDENLAWTQQDRDERKRNHSETESEEESDAEISEDFGGPRVLFWGKTRNEAQGNAVENKYRKSKLEIEIYTRNQNSKSKLEIKIQIRNSNSKFKLEIRCQSSKAKLD
mgnify:CR=1 FL=1